MASIGQARNKSALYKPTDFAGKQKRSSEDPNQNLPVVIKIQKRPHSDLTSKRLSELESAANMSEATVNKVEKPVTGISQKDLDKIKKLNEFMAKQQDNVCDTTIKGNNKKIDKSKDQSKGGKEKDKNIRPSSKNRRNRSAKPRSAEKPDEMLLANKQATKNASPASLKPEGAKIKPKVGKREGNNKQSGIPQHKGHMGPLKNQPAASTYYSQGTYKKHGSTQQWPGGEPMNNALLKQPFLHDTQIPASAMMNRKTVLATKDKSEQKKSLDFVKNFFETDPEVVHDRQQKGDKPFVKPIARVAHSQSAINRQDISSILTQPMYNASLQDTHRSVSMAHNHPAQLQSLIAHSNHLAALPSSYSVYQQQQLSNLGVGGSSALHGSSPGPLHHSGNTSLHNAHGSNYQNSSSNNYHALSHPTSMFQHQATGAYPTGMYSQLAQSTLLSPGSNYHDSVSNNSMANSGMQSYSTYGGNYFPPSGHQSHVQHVQQELDATAMNKILEETTFPDEFHKKKWQKTALSKCGPIDSKQARSLIEQLIDGSYECMVCCESVKWSNQVWSCANCFHIFHLSCIRKWAKSDAASVKDESGWRCPGCQNVSTRPPNKYYCFCGNIRDPDWNPRDGITPHSCGELCKKKRNNPPCRHACNELCHPGPCPACPVTITKYCPCGKTSAKTRCGNQGIIKCEKTCLKLLQCGQHTCQSICHDGSCGECNVHYSEECFCAKDRRYVVCGTGDVVEGSQPDINDEFTNNYSCGSFCERTLECGNHQCEGACHAGDCQECPLLPTNVKYCPCGKTPINVLTDKIRSSCLEPIPTCDGFCGKKLHCGPKGSPHLCMMKCHTGKCQPCTRFTSVQCRCAANKKEVACTDLEPGDVMVCERKCSKKRKCGRHKCNNKCCTDAEHACDIVCGKRLSCGLHKCDEVCHTGFCPPCWRAGFDELSCHCGKTVSYPPIACGSKPPECDQPCNRNHSCEHEPQHLCHSEETCPPCAVLTTKKCMGGHEVWKNIACHLSDVSCGKQCAKELDCGMHICVKKCHKASCLDGEETCTQPCLVKRNECDHPCAAPCHVGTNCPILPCKAQISIACRCGRRSTNALCLAGTTASIYQSFTAELLTKQLHNLQSGQSIDISSMTNASKRSKFLDCDEECARFERNRRLAEALGVENAEGNHFQNITFSLQLKQDAKSQLPFVQLVESSIESLVVMAKKSSQSQIHHSFPPMNTSQRKLIHELAEAYGCKTYSQDQEPKRNTVVIASKDSIIPNTKLSVLVERELTKNNPPKPVILTQDDGAIVLGPTTTSVKSKVDYFADDEFAGF